MARNKPGRPLTREQREAAATVTAEVTGYFPIRDHVTRESVDLGGTVRLDPTNGGRDPEGHGLQALVDQGSIRILPAETAKPAKPEKKEG